MSISFFSPIYAGPNASSHERCPFLRCTTHFFDFGQKAYTISHSNSFKIDVIEREDVQPSWMMTMVRIIALATLIIPLLMAIGSWIYRSVNSFQVVQLENHLHKLPDELITTIFKHAGPANLTLASTCKKNQEIIEKEPSLRGHRLILETLKHCYEEVKDLEDPEKSSTLFNLVRSLSPIDARMATQITGTIVDQFHCHKSRAFIVIAESLLESDPKKAEEILERAFTSINRAAATRTADEARMEIARNFAVLPECLKRALDIANSITNPFQKSTALAAVSLNLVKHNPQKADEVATEAYATGRFLNSFEKIQVLTEIAKSVASYNPLKTYEIAKECLEILKNSVRNRFSRSAYLISHLLPILKQEDASDFAEQALTLLKTFENSRYTLPQFAKVLAPSNLSRALEVLRDIEELSPIELNISLIQIAEKVLPLDSVQIIDECIKRADNFPKKYKIESLAAIARVLTQANPIKALELAEIAYAEAQTIQDENEKLELLVEILNVLAPLNHKRGEEVADLAMGSNTQDPATKQALQETIMHALVKINPEKVVEIANTIESSISKLEILSNTARILWRV